MGIFDIQIRNKSIKERYLNVHFYIIKKFTQNAGLITVIFALFSNHSMNSCFAFRLDYG